MGEELRADLGSVRAWMSSEHPLVIGGERRSEGGAGRFDVVSPVDERVVGALPVAGPADVADAVAAARKCADGKWGSSTLRERGQILRRFAELVEQEGDTLAAIEALDSGKAVSHVRSNDLPVALDALDTFIGMNRLQAGAARVLADGDTIQHELIEPAGVVAEILPWNGPIWTGVQQIAGIVAAGSTAVLKPSEHGSLPLAYLMTLLEQAGLPDGVINMVYGGPETGQALVTDPRIDLVSVTGGTATGAAVMAAAAPNVTRVSLELGGKNPCIVLADADLDQAAFWVSVGAFGNAGQICVSASRVLVAQEIYEPFIDRLAQQVAGMKVGDPTDVATNIGALVNRAAAQRAFRYIESDHGGRIVIGGTPYTDPLRSRGAFVPPTIIADVKRDSTLACEEVFAPVVAVMPVADREDAVRVANESSYGLSAGVFTKDLAAAWSLARRLRVGEVYVNRWYSPGVLEAPVEGQKRSGFGVAGAAKYHRRKNVFFAQH